MKNLAFIILLSTSGCNLFETSNRPFENIDEDQGREPDLGPLPILALKAKLRNYVPTDNTTVPNLILIVVEDVVPAPTIVLAWTIAIAFPNSVEMGSVELKQQAVKTKFKTELKQELIAVGNVSLASSLVVNGGNQHGIVDKILPLQRSERRKKSRS